MPRRPTPPPTLEEVHFAAPTGGTNTVDPASRMPETDCVYAYNLIADEYGLRSRLGFQEYCTGLTGSADNTVRTTVAFSGSHKNGSTDKLFGVTSSGIWDCTSSSASPSQLVTFTTQSGDAGFGVSTVATTLAGRFLLHCDEENGLYIWSEGSASWAKAVFGVAQPWTPSTFYEVGNQVVSSGNQYTCTSQGNSSSTTPPSSTTNPVTDSTVTWHYDGVAVANAIGPSLADQQAGFTGDPANFAAVCVWKNRVWFVEKDSTRAWYGGVNSIYGTFTSFDFGSKMRAGGPLANLYNWSYDAGNGLDTLLVGISTAGDVVIYQGTDPTSASTFGLKGCWFVSGVPYGRKVATDFGGDLLVMSLLGVVPLSRLVVGQPVVAGSRSVYETAKISNRFTSQAALYKGLQGWGIYVHPTDNALLLAVPTANGQATSQFAMSFVTRGWSQYRNLPLLSAATWNGDFYFGTADGRICKNTGYVDNVLLSSSSTYSPVAWSVLPAYQDGGNRRMKRVQMIRPILESDAVTPVVQVTAKYDFDFTEPAPPSGTGTATGTTWDAGVWDSSTWGGGSSPTQLIYGATGMGRSVSVAIQGNAIAKTTLVGLDVWWDEGGQL